MSKYYDDDDFDDFDDGEISKSQLKRDMHRFQALGETLSNLAPAKWDTLPISELLKNALVESRRITKHEARRRHFQYIGKIMRDEDLDAIQTAVDKLDPSSELHGRLIKQQEQWRSRLLDDANGLNDFIEEYPDVDRQQLRNLVRNAQKEMSSEPPKPGTNFKKLFQFIRTQMG